MTDAFIKTALLFITIGFLSAAFLLEADGQRTILTIQIILAICAFVVISCALFAIWL